jgi:hypothetical protein
MRSLVPRLVNEQSPAMSTSLFCRLSKSKTRSATVLVDEHKARGLRGGSKQSSDLGGKRLGSFRKKLGPLVLIASALAAFEGAHLDRHRSRR